MKNAILIICLLFIGIATSYSQVSETKSKAYFFSAEESYKTNKYSEALDLLDRSEKAGGASNEYIESLRVLCYGALNKWTKAQESLEACYSFNPSNDILKKLSPIIIRIDDEIEKEKIANQQKLIDDRLAEKRNYIRMLKSINALLNDRTDFEIIIKYDLLPFEENGKFGYVNKKGDVIVPAIYNQAGYFYNGYASVSMSSRSSAGLINEKGVEITSLKYNQTSSFSEEGLAYVFREKVEDEYSSGDFKGFIDASGAKVFSLKENDYLKYKIFFEGFLILEQNYEVKGFYNTSGQFISFYCEQADIFQNGMAAVKKNNIWGYINTKMELVIPYQYDEVGRFSDGLAFVVKNGQLGYIDKNGNTVISLQYKYDNGRSRSSFKNGFAVVMQNDKYGIINQNGDQICSIKYDSFRDAFWGFTQGLVLVKSKGKYGYINEKGEEKVALKYEYAKKFNNGLGAVKLNGKWGYVDINGELVIPTKYDSVSYFFEGKAVVKLNGETIVINKQGSSVY